MRIRTCRSRSWSLLVLGWASMQTAFAAPSELAPYAPDDFTLHLWHLDEKKPPFVDSAAGGTDLLGLRNGADAGEASLPGLGTSVSFIRGTRGARVMGGFRGPILLAAPELARGPADNAPPGFRYAGEDGAFTFEALARFERLPLEAGYNGAIVSMDGEGGNRVFDFRVESAGFLAFIPLYCGGGALAAIPASGPHAINTTDWFHIAVAYDGNQGVANNLRLYWTRLDGQAAAAHLIGRGSLAADPGSSVADFAIGNEARADNNAEVEPFYGSLDEVRISSVARDPTDFIFVSPERRLAPGAVQPPRRAARPMDLKLSGVRVDERSTTLPPAGQTLALPPGPHRLDFDFGVGTEHAHMNVPIELRCRLKGLDERWQSGGRGMTMTCEVLDETRKVVSFVRFVALGASHGWQTGIEDSGMTDRVEPLHVPPSGRNVRITLDSGAADTTGTFVIGGLQMVKRSPSGEIQQLWAKPDFGEELDSSLPEGVPGGWARGGTAPAIARVVRRASGPALALMDGDQSASGTWTATRPLPRIPPEGTTVLLKWRETYNAIGGNQFRVTFPSVPPGNYTFEAIATTLEEPPMGTQLKFPIAIRAPLGDRPWVWALAAALAAGLLAMGIVALVRRKARRAVRRLRLQNTMARERARVAREKYEELDNRIAQLTTEMSLAQRDMDRDPKKARRQLKHFVASAHELAAAMEELEWAVDPANDPLDRLGEHFSRLADEVFRRSAVKCTVDVPPVLPGLELHSDFRGKLSLAVKEAFDNIRRHAGPCRASLKLEVKNGGLEIVIADDGYGFEASKTEASKGRIKQINRLYDVGGAYSVESAPGKGTRVVMRCPLPAAGA